MISSHFTQTAAVWTSSVRSSGSSTSSVALATSPTSSVRIASMVGGYAGPSLWPGACSGHIASQEIVTGAWAILGNPGRADGAHVASATKPDSA